LDLISSIDSTVTAYKSIRHCEKNCVCRPEISPKHFD